MLTTIKKRQAKAQLVVVENLSKIPIKQVVCEKSGISRATFYRWINESNEFAEAVEKAFEEGSDRISDLAESKLIQLINEGNLTAVIFYLKHRNPNYRVSIKTEIKLPEHEMSEEEKEQLRKIVRINSGCKHCEKEFKEREKQLRREGKLIN